MPCCSMLDVYFLMQLDSKIFQDSRFDQSFDKETGYYTRSMVVVPRMHMQKLAEVFFTL